MPSPTETLLRVQLSPVPTQMFFALLGSLAIAPIDCTACLSNTGLNVVPPSSLRHTPPDAAPTKIVVLPPSLTAATDAMRPLIAADPMLRAPSPAIVPDSNTARPDGAGTFTGSGFTSPAGGMLTRAIGPAGMRNQVASTGTFTSARSPLIRLVRGPPWLPDSIANGIHAPATSCYP